MHERLPEDAFSIAVPDKIARNEAFQSHFEIFPHYQIIIAPAYDKDAASKMIEAEASKDLREFSKYVPAELSIDQKKEIMEMVQPQDPVGEVLGEQWWSNMLGDLYERYGLK